MTRNRLVFISDVHMGVGANTNWYERTLHEPMLLAALGYVATEADQVAELILLGDLFDQWTFVPDVRPPNLAAIAAANPAVLGPGGMLRELLGRLDGAVTYLPGNHDMSVGAPDLAALRDPQGRAVRFVGDALYQPAAGGGKVVCTHGHMFSVFNTPNPTGRLGLPLGHFVTRLGALWTAQHLAAGQTAADVSGSAEPTGWPFEKDELEALAVGVVRGRATLSGIAINALLEATGQPSTTPITLLDGSTLTAAAAAETLAGTFDDFDRTPGGAYGREPAFYALYESDIKSSLGHFAQVLGRSYPIVVMGHTHSPAELALAHTGGAGVYANSGFNCPARPDCERADAPRLPTFVEVELGTPPGAATVHMRAVERQGAGYGVADAPVASMVAAL